MSEFAGQALLGTCGWTYDDWEGRFYPSGTRGKKRLVHYARTFQTVEIDATFYAIPSRETVQNWRQRSPRGFIFSAKFPRRITHEKRLVGCGEAAATFVDVMSELGDRMGTLVLQLPPSLSIRAFDDLERFLQGLPDGFSYAVEVRNRSWLVERFAQLLKRWHVSLVLTDSGHMQRFWRVTSRIVYIRWLGRWNAFESYDRIQRSFADDLEWWVPRMEHFLQKGGTILGYVNNNFAGYSPEVVTTIQAGLSSAGD